MKCTRGNEKPYRAAIGTALQTTIATAIKAGVGTRVGAKVAVTAALEKKNEIDGIPAIH